MVKAEAHPSHDHEPSPALEPAHDNEKLQRRCEAVITAQESNEETNRR
jgi:hypothetical protein